MHESGEWIEYPPVMQKPAKPDPQQLGSTITYLKRYTLSAVFGITSDKDDDGEKGMNRNKQGEAQGFNRQPVQMTPDEKNELFKLFMARKEEIGKPATKEQAIAFIEKQEREGFGFAASKSFVSKMKY